MKKFLFEKLWMASQRERRARTIEFHPRKNLILGRNHTGKSSIIKTLFQTLGARPTGELRNWDRTIASVVEFKLESNVYRVVHQNGHRALFVNGALSGTASDHSAWTDLFVDHVGFNLSLMDKKTQSVPADARCFFLPFYVNQDGSWQRNWGTFNGLQQYKSPISPILDYFSGVRPPEYHELVLERTQLQARREELKREQGSLKRARERLEKSIATHGPKIDEAGFESEIERLTVEVTALNAQQEKLRETAVREQELIEGIALQIKTAEGALSNYDKDKAFIRDHIGDGFECPTCGAQHSEPFVHILDYAEDARVLRELVLRLRHDDARLKVEHAKTNQSIGGLRQRYNEISAILDTRRGDLKFRDVVDGIGAENADRAFRDEAAVLQADMDKLGGQIDAIADRLKEITNPSRTRAILTVFRQAYAAALINLNLPPIDTKHLKLTSRPDLSGSGGPRSILAYYSAIWKTCLGTTGSYEMPLVIDAPQQQGQDDVNLPRVLKFIANELPKDAQIILGIETEADISFDKIFHLDKPYSVLLESEYDEAMKFVDPLVTMMFAAMSR